RLAGYDALFVVGMDLLRQYVYYGPESPIPESIPIVHLDPDPWQLGKNYPLAVGLIGDPRAGLADLAAALAAAQTVESAHTARRPGPGGPGRRLGPLRHPGLMDGGPRTHPGDVRDLQQRSVSDPQGRRPRHGPATRSRRSLPRPGPDRPRGRLPRPGPLARRR